MKDTAGWFNMDWPYDLREHPERLAKFPLGPVHWDIRHRFGGGVLAEGVPANELRQMLKALFPGGRGE